MFLTFDPIKFFNNSETKNEKLEKVKNQNLPLLFFKDLTTFLKKTKKPVRFLTGFSISKGISQSEGCFIPPQPSEVNKVICRLPIQT